LSLRRICDLTPFRGALYAAHANDPLGTDGATISRYEGGKFSVAFDWNRPGEPTNGGGAGQGVLRVHAIVTGTGSTTERRLFVPDADPPYNGFGISEGGTEGFVFISDERGIFAKATTPHYRPPPPPLPLRPLSDDGGAAKPARAGASVLPRAYHVIDVIRF